MRAIWMHTQVPDLAYETKEAADIVALAVRGLRILRCFPGDAIGDW